MHFNLQVLFNNNGYTQFDIVILYYFNLLITSV